ncbi:hypothetical protein M9H77_22716 [Catharanthus roseus]|uniref:Uncharacterized protein n=1 Tax=Catharanthus roseus TaxID=4058 RepID=A0ACC0ATY2_CATRO|nr:hypothetical protein M9H77_22716 [Catharanthus roseus]
MAHHPHIWIYQEGLGTSIEEDPSEPTSDSEITPESERVALVGVGDMGTFVANSLPVVAYPTPIPPMESISSFPALPSLLRGGVRKHDICGYCLWCKWFIAQFLGTTRDSVDRACDKLESRPGCSSSQCPQAENMSGSQSPNHADEAVSESSQNRQPEPMRDATPRPKQATHKIIENFMIKMTELLETSMATRRNKQVLATRADEALERFLKFRPSEFYGEVEVELQRALAPLPPMGFAAAVEAGKRTEMANEAVIQRKTTFGSAATPYKHLGQGPWKPRDFKRSCGEQRTGNEGRPTLTPGGAHRDIPRTSALRCNKYLRRRLESRPTPSYERSNRRKE